MVLQRKILQRRLLFKLLPNWRSPPLSQVHQQLSKLEVSLKKSKNLLIRMNQQRERDLLVNTKSQSLQGFKEKELH